MHSNTEKETNFLRPPFLLPAIRRQKQKSKNAHFTHARNYNFELGFGRLCPKKKAYYAFSSAHFFRNYAKIMLLSENYALCHRLCYLNLKENKDHQYNFNFNEHAYSLPSSLTVLSITNTHVRTSKSQMINK